MPGRPRTMAKKLAELEEAAFQLNLDLCDLRPAQYAAREYEHGNDDLCLWWNEACRAVGMASIAANILLGCVEEKAGLDWEAMQHEREQRRGLVIGSVAGAEMAET